ncbi:hypothetical protein Cgig2_023426 [Carnegiea gigantea]|uniref:RRM domain-containing protein n=1 Tax=Carnegiea gigantea TaxID=171969 RepID=A0A9Q1K4G3_9CARY|nr:hypothetical protein Cgig2_023426 [Carnegiea gigantea]
MALRAAAAPPRGLWKLFSTSAFNFTPPPSSSQSSSAPPAAEPGPNLFVSGLNNCHKTHPLCSATVQSLDNRISFKPILKDPTIRTCSSYYKISYFVAENGLSSSYADQALSSPPSTPLSRAAAVRLCSFLIGLSKRTTTEGLREAFSKFGEIVHAKVVTDRVSGFSKGYGFVRYATTEEARAGIQGMDANFLDGWVIFAEFARPQPPPATPPSNGHPPYSTNNQQ